jgi:hypothetical protein
LRNRPVDEFRIQSVQPVLCHRDALGKSPQSTNDRLSLRRCRGRKIKNVTRLRFHPAVVDFLGDNFGDSLELNRLSLDLMGREGHLGQRACNDEIDLTKIRKGEFLEARTIALIPVKNRLKSQGTLRRIDKSEQLRS